MIIKNSKRKLLMAIIMLIIVISALCVVSVNEVKRILKDNIVQLEKMRLWLEDVSHIPITFQFIQNVLHIPFFALLSFFVMIYLHKRKISQVYSVIYALIIIIFLSFSTELIQFFIKGRDASMLDIGLDMIGYVIGVFLFMYRCKKCVICKD